MTLRVRLDGGRVADVSWEAVGCSISQASTSVMTELVIGKSIQQAMELREEFTELMHGQGKIEPNEDHLEDGIAFAGVAKFPARVKCALLGWSAFVDAAARADAGAPHQEETT